MGPNLEFQEGMAVLLHANFRGVFFFFSFLQLFGQGPDGSSVLSRGVIILQQFPCLCDNTDSGPGGT